MLRRLLRRYRRVTARGGRAIPRAGHLRLFAAFRTSLTKPQHLPKPVTMEHLKPTSLPIDASWLDTFDTELKRMFGVRHDDVDANETTLAHFADLPPHEAALAFGSDYDLERDDALWPRAAVPDTVR